MDKHELYVAGGGLVVAVLSLVVTLRQQRTSRTDVRISAQGAIASFRSAVSSWGSEALDVLAEATYRNDDITWGDQRLRTIHRLSALIDRGRLLFPNLPDEKQKVEIETAYSGSRHHVLDPLVAAIHVLEGERGGFKSHRDALLSMQREFTTRLQRVVDPRQSHKELQDLWAAANEGTNSDGIKSILDPSASPGVGVLLRRPA